MSYKGSSSLQCGQAILYEDGDYFRVAVVIEEKDDDVIVDINGKRETILKDSVDSVLTGGMVLEELQTRTKFIVGPEELI
jgi:hypothetical protein